MIFDDRADAGRRLAAKLTALRGQDVVVFGLPRGGVPVAAEVARALGAPLDVIVVRKLGVPSYPELAMGAVGEGGVTVVEPRVRTMSGVTADDVRAVERRERGALDELVARLRCGRPHTDVAGRTAVIVDDGLATGSTARAACAVARGWGAARVVVAVPVAPPATSQRLEGADSVVCVSVPADFAAVGAHYRHFEPVGEQEVVALLEAAGPRASGAPGGGSAVAPER